MRIIRERNLSLTVALVGSCNAIGMNLITEMKLLHEFVHATQDLFGIAGRTGGPGAQDGRVECCDKKVMGHTGLQQKPPFTHHRTHPYTET
jgi:hypothetical protein